MTTEIATQATVEDVSADTVVKAAGIQVTHTRNGDVIFINTDYVSPKLIHTLTTILDSEHHTCTNGESNGHGIFNVTFRVDGMPLMPKEDGSLEEVPWMFIEASKSIVCNIKRCVSLAFEQALNDSEDFLDSEHLDVKAIIWQHLLAGFLHESHHADVFMDDAMKLLTDPKAMQKEEEAADEYARLALFELAKSVDIEIDLGATIHDMYEKEFGIIWEDLATTSKDKLTVKELQFMECQEATREHGYLWVMKPEPGDTEHGQRTVTTFKELMHLISGDPSDDPTWNTKVTPAHVETIVTDNTASAEDAHGNVSQEIQNDPGQGADCMYNETTQASYGFQGTMPRQQHEQQQQNMGYPPQTQSNTTDQGYVAPTNRPVAPAGPQGVQTNIAPNHQYNQNAASGTDVGQTTSAQVGANEFPETTMSLQQFQAVVKGLYYKAFAQVFESCGFNPMNGSGQPFFMQSSKVVEPIMLTPEEQSIVHFMECYDSNGSIQMNAPVTDWISGRYVDKAKFLPGFVLTMSNMQGQRIRRKFIPQNPWKTNATGEYSLTAQQAQKGTRIMWIIDPDAVDKQFTTRILNGALQSNTSGEWADVPC